MEAYTLKPKRLEALQYKHDTIEFFDELKTFCGDDCTITYESCHIDNYWCIKVYDTLAEKWKVVPIHSYIVKLEPGNYTIMDSDELNKWCDKIQHNDKEGDGFNSVYSES